MRIATAMSLAAFGPNAAPTAVAATLLLAAAASGPRAARYATFARQYTPMRMTVPSVRARGKVRCGLTTSPAENVAYCQPSYAHSTAIIAIPAPARIDGGGASGTDAAVRGAPVPAAISATLMSRIAPTFTAVVHVCTDALLRVPTMLTPAANAIIATAAAFAPAPLSGTSCAR